MVDTPIVNGPTILVGSLGVLGRIAHIILNCLSQFVRVLEAMMTGATVVVGVEVQMKVDLGLSDTLGAKVFLFFVVLAYHIAFSTTTKDQVFFCALAVLSYHVLANAVRGCFAAVVI